MCPSLGKKLLTQPRTGTITDKLIRFSPSQELGKNYHSKDQADSSEYKRYYYDTHIATYTLNYAEELHNSNNTPVLRPKYSFLTKTPDLLRLTPQMSKLSGVIDSNEG